MADGPGKYDAEAVLIREENDADGVCVLVMGGKRGSAFAIEGTWDAIAAMPTILRSAADQIEKDAKRGPYAHGRYTKERERG